MKSSIVKNNVMKVRMKTDTLRRSIAIATFLLVLCLLAGSWTSAAPVASESHHSFYNLTADGIAALVRLSSAMTEAGILLCLGVGLVALSAVLQRARN